MPLRARPNQAIFPWVFALLLLLGTIPVLLLPDFWQSFWPPAVALLLVLTTRQAALGLGMAGLSGAFLLAHGQLGLAASGWLLSHAVPALTSPWHLGALVFTLLLGAFATILERGGSLLPLLLRGEHAIPSTRSRRRFLSSVFGLGLVCFFDGLANSLMVGRVARPVSDRLGIPRVLLAYLVDTTSSAVACIAFLSTWIAMQLTLIQDGLAQLPLEESAYLLFLRSIPHNYYCLFALLLAFLTVRRYWLIGPMRRAKPPEQEEDPTSALPPGAALWRAVIPLLALVVSIPLFYYFLPQGGEAPARFPLTLEKITTALGSEVGPLAFVCGSTLALLAAALCSPPTIRGRSPRLAAAGALQLLPSLAILILAWILGSTLAELGTARALAELLGGQLPLAAFPAAIFVVGCLSSFVSGTSWGTMALLMPLALPTLGPMAATQGLGPETIATLAPAVVAAVFGGAVFGDHCSPFSDTTIVSALACGVSTPAHTLTQLPYALLTAGVSLGCGYLLFAFGASHWIGLLAGSAVLIALVTLTGPKRLARHS